MFNKLFGYLHCGVGTQFAFLGLGTRYLVNRLILHIFRMVENGLTTEHSDIWSLSLPTGVKSESASSSDFRFLVMLRTRIGGSKFRARALFDSIDMISQA